MHPLRGLELTRPTELDRPGAVVRYWATGDTADPTVVFLHGATLDHRAWSPQADVLQDRFRVIAPDLRGHGASTGRFDYAAAVDDVLALLDDLDVEQVTLVGHSLGGNIAQEVIRRAPTRVTAFVAADSSSNSAARNPFLTSAAVAVVRMQAALAGPEFARQAARATATNPDVQRYALEANAHRSTRETADILVSLLTAAPRPDPAYRLPVPALLLHGEYDHIPDIASGTRAWARREPLAHHAVVPGAGHASNLDNPTAFTALLVSFLEGLDHPAHIGETACPVEQRAEELYLRYGAAPWQQLPETTREHFRGLVEGGIDGQGQPLTRTACG